MEETITIDALEEEEYAAFLKLKALRNKKPINNGMVHLIEGDLFQAPEDYVLAHCVDDCFTMTTGIACQFKSRTSKSIAEFLQHRVKPGSSIVTSKCLPWSEVYYLVTHKRKQNISYVFLWKSLQGLKVDMIENNYKKLAIPQLGCGSGGLDWKEVSQMLQYIFKDTGIQILVYIFKEDGVNLRIPLTDLVPGGVIIYICTVENFISKEMEILNKKFAVKVEYNKLPRSIGTAIKSPIVEKIEEDYLVYGLVVKDKIRDKIDFVAFEKCIKKIQKDIDATRHKYVAMEYVQDEHDGRDLTYKLVTILRSILKDVEIYVCKSSEYEE